jgi:hypothetical protein
LNSNKNQKNPFQRKILFIEYLTLSVVILLVCKHPDSLTTNTVIPYQGLFLRKEKPRLFEPEKQETPSVPLLRGRRPPLSLPGGRRMRDISFKVQGEWFFSEAGFFFLKVWISVRIGSDGGRQMVEVYFRPAA